MLAKSTNSDAFVEFLNLVRANLKPGLTRKPLLIYDMHGAHVSQLAAISVAFVPLPLPT